MTMFSMNCFALVSAKEHPVRAMLLQLNTVLERCSLNALKRLLINRMWKWKGNGMKLLFLFCLKLFTGNMIKY